ncbi:MAG: class IV adenylate cyclase [Nitrospirae bacterium]|nr:class IV adenylate cyclase [Nitrospirota bacterium]
MKRVNIEIKASCRDQNKVREVLLRSRSAVFIGEDHQVDTYFKVQCGRLKLREGNIEKALIYYEREDAQGPKKSEVILYKDPAPSLKDILTKALGVRVVVDKQREIYFIDNVKFHLDTVQGLGSFIEIEAIDDNGSIGEVRLLVQCKEYLSLLEITDDQLIAGSYSDLVLKTETDY